MKMRVFAGLTIVAILAAGVLSWRALADDASGSGWLHEAGSAWNAERALVTVFDRGRPNVTIVVEATDGNVDDRPVEQAARRLTLDAEERGLLAQVESYWSLDRPSWLRSEDGQSALILARIPGESIDLAGRAETLVRMLDPADVISVKVGGEAMVHRDIAMSMTRQLSAVLIAALAALLLTLVITRNVQAVALVGIGTAVAIAVTLSGLRILGRFVDIPTLAVVLGVATTAGLTLSGGHLMARRYLAEQSLGADRRQAVAATVATAGRNVTMGAAVTAVAGVVMWFLPTTLLRSSGYAVAMGALVAGLVAVALLGLVLAVVAPSPQRMRSRDWRPAPHDAVSRGAMRRPVVIGGATTLLLAGLLVYGFVQSPLGTPGPETLSAGSSSRAVAQQLAASYGSDEAGAPFIIGRGIVALSQVERQAATYAAELSQIPSVARVDAAQGSFVAGEEVETPTKVRSQYRSEAGLWLKVPVEGSATGRRAVRAIKTIDEVPAPFRVQVGGLAARQMDTTAAVGARFPVFILLALAGIALVIAWLLRSVNAAIRATISIAAVGGLAGGIVRWGFADGILAGPLGFVPTGTVDAVGPPLAWAVGVAIAGVAMSYGWCALREMNDASHGDAGSAGRALAATRGRHLEATAMMTIPFAPLVVAGWRPAQLVGVAALVTGLSAATVGRFVLLPALVSFRSQRLWPVDARGDQRRVFPTTTYGRAVVRAVPDVASDSQAISDAAAAFETVDTDPAPTPTQIDHDAPTGGDDTTVTIDEPLSGEAAPAVAPKRRRRKVRQRTINDETPAAADATTPVDADEAPTEKVTSDVTESDDVLAAAKDTGGGTSKRRRRRATQIEPSTTLDPPLAGEATVTVQNIAASDTDIAESASAGETSSGDAPSQDTSAQDASVGTAEMPPAASESAPPVRRRKTRRSSASDAAPDDTSVGADSVVAISPEPDGASSPQAPPKSTDDGEASPDAATPHRAPTSDITAGDKLGDDVPRGTSASAPSSPDAATEPTINAEEASSRTETATTDEKVTRSSTSDVPPDAGTISVPPPPAALGADHKVIPVAAVPSPPVKARRNRKTVNPTRRGAGPAQPSDSPPRPVADTPLDHNNALRDAPAGSTDGEAATVDVVSLTESVIASIDADTPFTTEVGSGFVSNPSNNLSRVMETILRDASVRGGDEVLVYGHAARGRYRWMVVDSGPHADRDPDRARTLAEAQRFIRRVGGVVECRPEGDFTVFVVEIPVAS